MANRTRPEKANNCNGAILDPVQDLPKTEEVAELGTGADAKHFFKREDWWAAAAAFLFSTFVFLRHMAPEVTLQDSGELVTGAFTFGVPHPPGYPLWALLGYIWSHVIVPFGNPAWRIGTMSVATGGLTVGILTLMMTRSTRALLHSLPWTAAIEERLLHWIALSVGVSSALLFGFNRGVWLWASVSEMRVLNAFSFVLIACTFFAWMIQPRRKGFLYATLLIYGLSMTNHQTVAVMALALVVGTLALGIDEYFRRREQLPAGGSFDLPLLMSCLTTFWELSVAVLFSLSAVFLLFAWLHTGGDLTDNMVIWRVVLVIGLLVAGVLGMSARGTQQGGVRKILVLVAGVVLFLLYYQFAKDPLLWKAVTAEDGRNLLTERTELLASWAMLLAGAVMLGIGSQKEWVRPRYALLYTALFLAGCAFYLYMPIASATNPPMNWGYASTKEGFLHAITRGQYEKLQMADPFGNVIGIQLWIFIRGMISQYSWPLSLFGLVTVGIVTVWLVRRMARNFAENRWLIYVWLGALPLSIGFLALLRKLALDLPPDSIWPPLFWGVGLATIFCLLIGTGLYLNRPGRSWLIFVWAAFLASSIGLILIINPKLDKQEQEITIKFFAPAHGFYAMLIGYGIAVTMGFVLRMWKDIPRLLVQLCCVALLALPLITYRQNWSLCALETHDFGYQFGYRMFCPGGGYPDMEKDAVLYGGTDPGRFVPTYMIFCESRVAAKDRFQSPYLLPKDGFKEGCAFDRSDVYIITQNALADNTYMSYIRDHYDYSRPDITNASTLATYPAWRKFVFGLGCSWLERDRTFPHAPIRIPSPDDSTKAFQQFVEEWKAGRAPPGADLKMENGRVQVTGVQAVMAINGILAKWIFDWNKETHSFYVEESYVIPWMYPYLRPAGVIMKIEKEQLPPPQQDPKLWNEIVAKDKAYWDQLTRDFTSREEFRRNKDAQKSFSKMRSAIAGLYQWRGMLPEAEYAYRQSLQLCPDSPEGCFRLADLFLGQRRYGDASQLMAEYAKVDPYNGSVSSFRSQIDGLRNCEKRRIELQTKMEHGAELNDILELLTVYGRMNLQGEMTTLGMNLLNNTNVPPLCLLQLAQLFNDARRLDLQQEALRRYLIRQPQDSRIWLELGWTQLLVNQSSDALSSWRKAVSLGGDAVRLALRKDPRFQALWQQRDLPQPFRDLLQIRQPAAGIDLGL